MNQQEEKMIILCQAGQGDNFTFLYDKYVRQIYSFVYYRVNHQQATEDIVSQAFLKAWRGLKSFDSQKGHFSSWLYKITRNEIADYYRRHQATDDLDSGLELKADENVQEKVEQSEKKERIHKALEDLKPEQKEIVILRVWQELSYQEIAEIMDKSVGSCKMVFSRAVNALRHQLPLNLLIILLIN